MTTLDIRLKKVNKVYHEGETVAGVIIVESKTETKHEGLTLWLEGTASMQLSAKNVGIFEAFYSSAKPVQLIGYSLEIAKAGRLPAGRTEMPFELPLRPRSGRTLYETYHGVFINIQYLLRCEMKRSLLSKDVQKTLEFIVELQHSRVPRFLIKGRIDSTCCCITKPFTGVISVESCDSAIRSIELQLVRVETCGCAEGYARDATEIQNIQIGEGDVCRGINIPIYMVFPRLFTCPTLITNNFKIEFEVNIVVVFEDDHLMTENYPIKLTRF
ncbi:vacuolar protein sorting-associated protein 26C isoform X2 [Rhipicephalus microplus]|uniref:vacuolar protein sorting-associated protein 26C isoform X2 n=1 Tax=Rhipicephalus microplus TaxID=6941 RepID=UPI0018895970|nr:vacuolar protein sorting-associated protein 26C-like isoform X2 [Rhipicephalus microplus]